MWDDYTYRYEREARQVLASQMDTIEGMDGAVAEPRLLKNPPIDAILDLCEGLEPDLLVMGSRGLGPNRRTLVGSVAEGLVHHSRCPMLVVRGGEGAWPPARIVVGHDGSDDAERAGELAAGIGKLFGAEGVLVRSYQNPPEPVGGWSAEDRRKLDEVQFRQEGALKKRARELEKALGTRLGVEVLKGDTVSVILEVAGRGDEQKTLVAVGSRGLSVTGWKRLGGVSSMVLRAARGPVLVWPHTQRFIEQTPSRPSLKDHV